MNKKVLSLVLSATLLSSLFFSQTSFADDCASDGLIEVNALKMLRKTLKTHEKIQKNKLQNYMKVR